MKQELYPFENAVMHITIATSIPPIFNVEVTGQTGSLNPIIHLTNTGNIEEGYLILELLGKDGDAIGSAPYSKNISILQEGNTNGVMVKGLKKDVKLDWENSNQISPRATTGLFHLPLRSKSRIIGAPILHLQLGVDTINHTVSGIATVTQALAEPVVSTSHVTGKLIYETVMKPGKSMIRIDLSGYPEIHWPKGMGIGPIISKNFSSIILFDEHWGNGIVDYQYLTSHGFVKQNQKIVLIKSSFSKSQLEPNVLELN
jgi:hypothetical protein